jgi:outer membrane protein OmpA-like peptidoglycan-associated protein
LAAQRQEEERIAKEREDAAAKAKAEAEARAQWKQLRPSAKPMPKSQRQAELLRPRKGSCRPRNKLRKAEAERVRKAAEALACPVAGTVQPYSGDPRHASWTGGQYGGCLFDTGKFDLRSEAREKLAKLSGIVLAHPD